MPKFDVVVTLVVRWFKDLVDMQGDDQMRIKKRSVRAVPAQPHR